MEQLEIELKMKKIEALERIAFALEHIETDLYKIGRKMK
jgi:hypothetical protein